MTGWHIIHGGPSDDIGPSREDGVLRGDEEWRIPEGDGRVPSFEEWHERCGKTGCDGLTVRYKNHGTCLEEYVEKWGKDGKMGTAAEDEEDGHVLAARARLKVEVDGGRVRPFAYHPWTGRGEGK